MLSSKMLLRQIIVYCIQAVTIEECDSRVLVAIVYHYSSLLERHIYFSDICLLSIHKFV